MLTQSRLIRHLIEWTIVLLLTLGAAKADTNFFDTPTGDRLYECEYRIARQFQYDFNEVEMPAADQALAAYHRSCRSEIAAMQELIPHWFEQQGQYGSIAERADRSALITFQNAQNDIDDVSDTARHPLEPGASAISEDAHLSVLAHPSPISASEIALVRRHDAVGWPPDTRFHGRIGDYTYNYEPSGTSGWPPQRWDATLESGSEEVWIKCNKLASAENTCRITFYLKGQLDQRNFLEVLAGGNPFTIHGVCDPGGFGIVVDAPEPNNIAARHASLSVDDGAPIALPNGEDCIADKDGSFAAEILSGHRFRASFAPPFRERIFDVSGTSQLLGPAMALAAHVYNTTRDELDGPNAVAEIDALSERAQPFTLEEALGVHHEWRLARDCSAAHVSARSGSDPIIAYSQLKSGTCRDELADLDWQAAKIGLPIGFPSDADPRNSRGSAARMEQSRSALVADASTRAHRNQPIDDDAPFLSGERAASVMGFSGFAGVRSTSYGYFVSPDFADAAVAGGFDFQGGTGYETRGIPTTIIRCHRGGAFACEIRVPFEAGSGNLIVHTNGARAGSKICVESSVSNLAGWTLAEEYHPRSWKLDDHHCIRGDPQIPFSELNEWGLRLKAPGEAKGTNTRFVEMKDFVLSLTSYLVLRLEYSRPTPG
jgi:hypothetical protein